MANTMKTVRISSLIAHTRATKYAAQRSFTSFHRNRAATNFTMPALSPTMTEGTIASWRVKEGDSFSAGDVLLEIETDKATMDVEAQDDGILMKIIVPNESKAIQVGSRIAVVAEPGDDVSSLELPPDEGPKQASKSTDQQQQQQDKTEEKSQEKPKQSAKSEESQSSGKTESQSAAKNSDSSPAASDKHSGKGQNKKYPLYPSVQHLLHENGIEGPAIDQIQATGPNGRLLKGDVLAYLGRIDKAYPAEASARLTKLSHLDLSNIQLADKKPKTLDDAKAGAKDAPPAPPKNIDFALPISLTAVIETQKRVESLLKTSIPLSVFIARASELANEDLPVPKQRKISSDELFNAVLGVPGAVKTTSRGNFVPQLSTIDLAAASRSRTRSSQPDIIDILAGKRTAASSRRTPTRRAASASGLPDDLFSVTAKPGEEQRAMLYLERLKLALETDPGRLVV